MNQSVKNILIDLITPICLILLAVSLRPYLPALDIAQTQVFTYLPFILLLISLLISWQFNQLDSFYLSLLLTVVYIGILEINQETGVSSSFNSGHYVAAISILLPLNFILFKLFHVASVFSVSGLFRIVLIALQSYGTYWVIQNQYTPAIEVLGFEIFPNTLPLLANMPQIAVLIFAIAILVQIGFVIVRQSPLESTLLGAFIITFIACYFGDEEFIFLSAFSAAAMMLTIATVQASYNMAFIDTLTALPSRRAMENELKKLGRRYSIAMLDIDHFKKLNDTYGHDVGDQVLRMVAKHIRRVGGGGRPARYGGEEFAVIFPNRTIIDATPFLEIVRANIENAGFALRDNDRPKKIPKTRKQRRAPSNEIFVTISIGLAEKTRIHKSATDVMKSADDALYKAKKQGRNRLCH